MAHLQVDAGDQTEMRGKDGIPEQGDIKSALSRMLGTFSKFSLAQPCKGQISSRVVLSVPFIVGLVLLVVVFQGVYATYPPVPGNDQAHPLGWWGWFDQGEYYKSAVAFSHGDLRASQHFYPPLYAAMASVFLPLSKLHAFYPIDLGLLLAFYMLFIGLFSRYVGCWGAVICCLLGMVVFHPLRLQWVIPWTSTPSAVLILASLYLLDRYARQRDAANWGPYYSGGLNALVFGLVVGAESLIRPVDIAVAAPMAIAYAVLLAGEALANDRRKRRNAIVAMFGGILGFLLPLLAFWAFNRAVFGSAFGQYFGLVSSNGFNVGDLPEKLFSQLLASQIFYGEQNADWLSVIPLILAAVLVLPGAIFSGPLVFRTAAAAGLTQFVFYYSYSDILPTGTFRYFNIHYFKWLAPVALVVAFYFVLQAFARGAVQRRKAQAVLGGSVVFGLLVVSVTATQDVEAASNVTCNGKTIAFNLPGKAPINFIDLSGFGGGWTEIYFAKDSSVVLDGTRHLALIHDYRFLPIRGGVRVLFFNPVHAHEIKVQVGDGMTVTGAPLCADVQPVSVMFSLGIPFGQQWAPAQPPWPPAPYAIGTMVDLSSQGNGEPYLRDGWYGGEDWGRWIDGDGQMEFNLGARPKSALALHLTVQGLVVGNARPAASADVYAGGQAIGRISVGAPGRSLETFHIPADLVEADGKLTLQFRNLSPASPRQLHVNQDHRKLSVGLIDIQITPAAAANP